MLVEYLGLGVEAGLLGVLLVFCAGWVVALVEVASLPSAAFQAIGRRKSGWVIGLLLFGYFAVAGWFFIARPEVRSGHRADPALTGWFRYPRNARIALTAAVIASSLVPAVGGFVAAREARAYKRSIDELRTLGITEPATVTQVRVARGGGCGHLRVHYRDATGQAHSVLVECDPTTSSRAGETVKVVYDPNDTNNAALAPYKGEGFDRLLAILADVAIGFSTVVVCAILIALAIIWRPRRRADASQPGTAF